MIFKPYVLKETVIEKALDANWCVRWIEAFVANLGHPLWGSQSMQELASEWGMFCLSSLEMLSPALTASPIKGVPDMQWMPLFISHTNLHVVLSLWRSLLTHRVWKSPKSETNFLKECIKARKKYKRPVPPKLKLCTHLLCTMQFFFLHIVYIVELWRLIWVAQSKGVADFKVPAKSHKLEIRLYTLNSLARTHNPVTNQFVLVGGGGGGTHPKFC